MLPRPVGRPAQCLFLLRLLFLAVSSRPKDVVLGAGAPDVTTTRDAGGRVVRRHQDDYVPERGEEPPAQQMMRTGEDDVVEPFGGGASVGGDHVEQAVVDDLVRSQHEAFLQDLFDSGDLESPDRLSVHADDWFEEEIGDEEHSEDGESFLDEEDVDALAQGSGREDESSFVQTRRSGAASESEIRVVVSDEEGEKAVPGGAMVNGAVDAATNQAGTTATGALETADKLADKLTADLSNKTEMVLSFAKKAEKMAQEYADKATNAVGKIFNLSDSVIKNGGAALVTGAKAVGNATVEATKNISEAIAEGVNKSAIPLRRAAFATTLDVSRLIGETDSFLMGLKRGSDILAKSLMLYAKGNSFGVTLCCSTFVALLLSCLV